eukprot:COSAG02_NODE_13632_length_1369_cov_1.637795_2_plen_111_part_00
MQYNFSLAVIAHRSAAKIPRLAKKGIGKRAFALGEETADSVRCRIAKVVLFIDLFSCLIVQEDDLLFYCSFGPCMIVVLLDFPEMIVVLVDFPEKKSKFSTELRRIDSCC